MFSVYELMDNIYQIQQSSFPELLKGFLDERGVSRADLYEYLLEQQFLLEKTSMYRYFNTTNPKVARLPEREFLRHFAAFLNLTYEQESALYFLYEIKRTRRKAG